MTETEISILCAGFAKFALVIGAINYLFVGLMFARKTSITWVVAVLFWPIFSHTQK